GLAMDGTRHLHRTGYARPLGEPAQYLERRGHPPAHTLSLRDRSQEQERLPRHRSPAKRERGTADRIPALSAFRFHRLPSSPVQLLSENPFEPNITGGSYQG